MDAAGDGFAVPLAALDATVEASAAVVQVLRGVDLAGPVGRLAALLPVGRSATAGAVLATAWAHSTTATADGLRGHAAALTGSVGPPLPRRRPVHRRHHRGSAPPQRVGTLMVVLAELRRWDPVGLESVVRDLGWARQGLLDLDLALHDARPPAGWSGLASEAPPTDRQRRPRAPTPQPTSPPTTSIGLVWAVLSERSMTLNAAVLGVLLAAATIGLVLGLGPAGVGAVVAALGVGKGAQAVSRWHRRARIARRAS